jgi:hypothetical protein
MRLVPKATLFGRQSWTPAAITAIHPNASWMNIRITASLILQVRLTSPASQATPMTEFWMMP